MQTTSIQLDSEYNIANQLLYQLHGKNIII